MRSSWSTLVSPLHALTLLTYVVPCRAFQTFGGFTSGIGIQYSASPITNITYQSLAVDLEIGKRMPPQIIIRAADFRPFELHDLIPSDTRFKVLIFTGDLDNPVQMTRVESLAAAITGTDGFLTRFGGESWHGVFDILTILVGKKETVNYTTVPAVLRPHWSK